MAYKSELQGNNNDLRGILDVVNSLPEVGGIADPILQEKSVTPTKSEQAVVPDTGFDGLSRVNVEAIPEQYIIPEGTKSITKNGSHDVKEVASVNVNVPIPEGYIQPSGTKDVTENGMHDVTEYASVNVAVPEKMPVLQDKTITENGTYTADAGYDGFGTVTVNVPTGEDLNGLLTEQENLIAELQETLRTKVESGGGAEDHLGDFLTDTLTDIDSDVTKIVSYGSYGRTALKTVNLPSCTDIDSYAFRGCSNITNVNTPIVASVGSYAFYGCSKLTDINIPNISSTGTYAFYKCDLRSVNFPKLSGISQNVFFQNENLQRADFGKANKINQAAFANCIKLDTLILRLTSGVCTLGTAASSLENTPIANGTGYIYVPSALIETYKTATNWVNYANQFRAIEDYPEICGG